MKTPDLVDKLIESAIGEARSAIEPKPARPDTRRLAPRKPAPVKESHGEDDDDGSDLVQRWLDAKQYYSFEGERGVERFQELAQAIGYSDVDEFLCDNPGALDAMVAFVEEWVPRTAAHGADGWASKLRAELEGLEEEKGADLDGDDEIEDDDERPPGGSSANPPPSGDTPLVGDSKDDEKQ